MTYRGKIKNGAVIVDVPIPLPDGAEVEVQAIGEPKSRSEPTATLYERYQDFIGIVDDLPPDFAENHDHYIHGTPRHMP